MSKTPAQRQILTTAQAAEVLGVAEHTLNMWRSQKKGPPYCKLNKGRGAVRYLLSDIMDWMDSKKVEASA